MSDVAVRVVGIGKEYHIGGQAERHDRVSAAVFDAVATPFRRIRNVVRGRSASLREESFWALKDINFEVKQGEVLGIIGRNGSGKSTLLKILSRITEPTKGHAEIYGRVGALLEVGTGFHPELTGRENIFLNGAILGMSQSEIRRKFDEIIDFSGIGKFVDTPVKHYSSGMGLRLGFAVAAHLEPEILIVDEVLAVGDAEFQKKCLGKMSDIAGAGRTVLFVSHNMTAVRSLCQTALLLRNGDVIDYGDVDSVVTGYLTSDRVETRDADWVSPEDAPGNDAVRIKSVRVIPASDNGSDQLTIETPYDVAIEFWNFKPGLINISLHIQSISGETIFAATSPKVPLEKETASFVAHIPGRLMNDGIYTVTVMIVKEGKSLFTLRESILFEIHDTERQSGWMGRWPGAVRPELAWDYSTETAAVSSVNGNK